MSTGHPGTPAAPAAPNALVKPVKPLFLIDVDGPINPTTLRVRKDDEEGAAFVVHLMRPRGHEELSPEEFERQMLERRMQRLSGFKTEGKPGDPLKVRISPLHVAEFALLCEVFDVVWATTWLDEANRLLSPLLGLPEDLPWVPFTDEELSNKKQPQVGRRNGSWKTPIIARWLDQHHPGRAWAWADDEVNQRDRAWFRDHHYGLRPNPPAHLVLRVEDHRGLRAPDFARLRDFARHATTTSTQ